MDEIITYDANRRPIALKAAAAALTMSMAAMPFDFPPPHSPGRRKKRRSAKAIKAAKLHAMQRKARKIQRAKAR